MKSFLGLFGLGLGLVGNAEASDNALEQAAAKYNAKIVWVDEGTPLYTVASTFERGNKFAWTDYSLTKPELIVTNLCDDWQLRGRISTLNNQLADLTATVATEAGPGFESLASAMRLDNVMVKLADGTTCTANPRYVPVPQKDGLRGDGAAKLHSQSLKYPVAVPNSYFPAASSTPAVDNHKPVIEKINDLIYTEGETVSVFSEANDPDGDNLTYTYKNIPKGNVNGNEWTWNTDFNDAGSYNVDVCVSDGQLEDCTSFNVKVNDVPSTSNTLAPREDNLFFPNGGDYDWLTTSKAVVCGEYLRRNMNLNVNDNNGSRIQVDEERTPVVCGRLSLPIIDLIRDPSKDLRLGVYADGKHDWVGGESLDGIRNEARLMGMIGYSHSETRNAFEVAVGNGWFGQNTVSEDEDLETRVQENGSGLNLLTQGTLGDFQVGVEVKKSNLSLTVKNDKTEEVYGKPEARVSRTEIFGNYESGISESFSLIPNIELWFQKAEIDGDKNVTSTGNKHNGSDLGVDARFYLGDKKRLVIQPGFDFNVIDGYSSDNQRITGDNKGTYKLGLDVGYTW